MCTRSSLLHGISLGIQMLNCNMLLLLRSIVSCFKHAKLHTFCITYVKVCTYIVRVCTCNLPSKLGMQCICYDHVVIRHAISSTYYLLGYCGDLIHLSHSRFPCRSGLTVHSKGVGCFPSVPAPSHSLTLNFSGSFTSFESEFKTWLLPSEQIDENSLVFAAAEILRFLCNMAINISTAQSKSLLQIQHKHKNSSASPPTTAAALLCSTPPPIWCTPVLSYAC